MDFRFSDDQEMIRAAAAAFAQEQIRPRAHEIEEDEPLMAELLREMGQLGLPGMCVSEDLGGIGADTLSFVLAVEEISKASAAMGLFLIVNNAMVGEALRQYGRDEVRSPWLSRLASGDVFSAFAGAGAGHVTVIQADGGYRLNGRKEMTPAAGVAEVALVHARISAPDNAPQDALLLVPADTDGLTAGARQKTVGLRAAAIAPLAFHECFVPDDHLLGAFGQGMEIIEEIMGFADIGVAAQALGLAEAAYEEAVAYAGVRKQFDRPIVRFQAVGFMLAEMQTAIEAARHLTYHAAWLRDQKRRGRVPAAQARLHAVGMANYVTDTALQIHGGYGYIREYPVERYFRDARMLGVIDGDPDAQKRVIAASFEEES